MCVTLSIRGLSLSKHLTLVEEVFSAEIQISYLTTYGHSLKAVGSYGGREICRFGALAPDLGPSSWVAQWPLLLTRQRAGVTCRVSRGTRPGTVWWRLFLLLRGRGRDSLTFCGLVCGALMW